MDKWKESKDRKLAIVRIRGRVGVKPDIRETLEKLRLKKKNVCVVINAEKQFLGMLKVVEPYVAWGEIDKKTFAELLKKRAKVSKRKKLTEEYLKERGFNSCEDFVNFAWEDPLRNLKKLGIKPVFFLNSPSRGYARKGIKAPKSLGGAWGYWGEEINDLLSRMI